MKVKRSAAESSKLPSLETKPKYRAMAPSRMSLTNADASSQENASRCPNHTNARSTGNAAILNAEMMLGICDADIRDARPNELTEGCSRVRAWVAPNCDAHA